MKIKQYQSGGIVYLPTSNRREAAQTAASSSDDSKVPGFTKELIALVKENGLDSDVSTFLKQVERTLDLANDPTGQNLSMREILKVQRLASQVATNYKDYEKARQSLDEQDAWGEMATDKRGYLYVQNQDTGKIETVSHSSYTENPEKYLALTNEDVLNIRRADPTMAYRMDILDNISSAVGMKTITDYAKGLIKEFGKTSITGYSEKQAEKIRSGLEHIVAGDLGDFRGILTAGPDGVYKISSEATIADTGIKEALNYLVSTLPRNYQNTLGAKATVEGYSPEAMLMQMMYYNTDRTLKADYDQTASKDAGYSGAGKTPAEQLTENTYLERIAQTRLDPTEVYISPIAEQVDDKSQLATIAWKAGMLVDKNGNGITEHLNLNVAKGKVEAIKAADSNSITFGNQLVSPEDTKKIIWDGNSELAVVMLPWKNQGGKKVPDFDALDTFNKFQKFIKDNQPSALEINNYIAQNFSQDEVKYDASTNTLEFNPAKMMKFLTFSGIASSDVMDIEDSSKKYLLKMDSSKGKYIVDFYNNNIQYGKENPTKYDRPDKSVGKANKTGFYRGNIYMPIESPLMAFHMSNNEFVPKTDYMQVPEKWELTKQMQQMAQSTTGGLVTTFN